MYNVQEIIKPATNFSGSPLKVTFAINNTAWVRLISAFYNVVISSGSFNIDVVDSAGSVLFRLVDSTNIAPHAKLQMGLSPVVGNAGVTSASVYGVQIPEFIIMPPNSSIIITGVTGVTSGDTVSMNAIVADVETTDASAWTPYTPTVSAAAGTPTTVSATGRYKQNGKTVIAEMDIVITDIGTATGALRATLPVNSAAFKYAGIAFEYSTTGKSGAGYIQGNTSPTLLQSRDAAAGSWWVNGYTLAVTVTYEAA